MSNNDSEVPTASATAPDLDDLLKVPTELAILPVSTTLILPNIIGPLVVAGDRSLRCIDAVAAGERLMALVAPHDPAVETPGPDDLCDIGTGAVLLKMLRFPDGTTRVLVQGVARVRLLEFTQEEPYLKAKVERLPEVEGADQKTDALRKRAVNQFEKMVSLVPHLPDELRIAVLNIQEPGNVADFIAANLNINLEEKQEILQELNVRRRLEVLLKYLDRELGFLELGSKIREDVQGGLNKSQREYFLREQLKAIQKELGEEEVPEIKELRERIEKARMPKEARAEADRELDRLVRMSPASAEYTVSRTYLDWLCELPWSKSTKDKLDVRRAHRILEADHYDLEKPKQRILEYLAVRKLKADTKGPILCFVGPPGTGKTSLGRSIARALGREFVRLSLGGVRDEAEIRGHRRTYVGALPGRIIQSLRKVGSNNPVFMLDEVDKLGADFRGDPASALLEVLDPEQNFSFSDHYLDVPFDLSTVMFITTANLLDPIPPALRDRMEVLELHGYTEREKLIIARKYLIPKQIEMNGLKKSQIRFLPTAVRKVIRDHTREAGLRNLEREIGSICRKVARGMAEGKIKKAVIKPTDVAKHLGPTKYHYEVAERTKVPGVATGVAWTSAGGDILFIESTVMKGGRGLFLTGHLGEVMKESAQAALSFIRSHADDLGLSDGYFRGHDIHVHVPAGAIPKDGPSAGVAIALSLVSLFTNTPVPHDIAVTGEITLKGRVLPVGGVKEKVLGAHRAGIKTFLLPKRNLVDLEDVPKEVRRKMKFIPVVNLEDVLQATLGPPKRRRTRRKSNDSKKKGGKKS